jgi:hypothetical protein
VTQYLALFDCQAEVIEAARAGKIGPTVWYAVSRSPDQLATLALKLNGATRDEVAKSVRKPKADAVRTAKIKCPLPSGQVVTVAGEGISLEEAVEALAEAAKAMKAALAKSLNAKTAMAYWRDIAAAG